MQHDNVMSQMYDVPAHTHIQAVKYTDLVVTWSDLGHTSEN